MELRTLGFIYVTIGIILLISGMIILSTTTMESTEQEVKCFDGNNNEIVGMVCIEETTKVDALGASLLALGFIFCIMGFVLLMLSGSLENDE